MKNIILAALFVVSATTVFADGVSKPLMDVKVVAAKMDQVSTSSKGTYIIMALLVILFMDTVK
tara:strand:- start:14 stop:202 length:189 start_codon:yes stop_codon:yes gene_type:complete